MVKVYLFIELLRAANAPATVDHLKGLEIASCKLANVVALSGDKLVGQLDCDTFADADKAILEKIAPVEGIVQTSVIATVRPVHHR
jgi:hypothetical protein